MQITEVRVRLRAQGNFLGYADITLDNRLAVHNLRIIKGAKGLFVAMPSIKRGERQFEDIVHPTDQPTREWITDTVLKSYKEQAASAPYERYNR
ncbi:MAG: SpoVG family protein [bacterium]